MSQDSGVVDPDEHSAAMFQTQAMGGTHQEINVYKIMLVADADIIRKVREAGTCMWMDDPSPPVPSLECSSHDTEKCVSKPEGAVARALQGFHLAQVRILNSV